MRALCVLGLAALLTSTASNASAVSQQAFIDLFGGTWVGSGTVVEEGIPLHVGCSATGQTTTNHLTVEGICTVSIVSVRIAADIRYDPATGRFSGTYIGARVGPAYVSGRSKGNAINLRVTWPKPVNGDTTARMTIVNTGNRFRLTLRDNATPGGPEELMSDVVLLRK